MDGVAAAVRDVPGVDHAITIGGVSLFDNNASLANAGIVYVILKDWSQRGAGEDLLSVYSRLQARLDENPDARSTVVPPPPIQGLGLAGGFQMQVQVTDGSFDYVKLQAAADAIVAAGNAQPSLTRLMTPFRAGAPQLRVDLDRRKVETMGINVERCLPDRPGLSRLRPMSGRSPASAIPSRCSCRPTRPSARPRKRSGC